MQTVQNTSDERRSWFALTRADNGQTLELDPAEQAEIVQELSDPGPHLRIVESEDASERKPPVGDPPATPSAPRPSESAIPVC